MGHFTYSITNVAFRIYNFSELFPALLANILYDTFHHPKLSTKERSSKTFISSSIVIPLLQHSRNRDKNLGTGQTSDSESIRIARMLVTVSVGGFVLRAPMVVTNAIILEPYLKQDFDVWWLSFWTLMLQIVYSLNYFNSCINFFIYISMSSNFKKHFIRIFCPCFKNKDQGKAQKGRGPELKPATSTSDTVISEANVAIPSSM